MSNMNESIIDNQNIKTILTESVKVKPIKSLTEHLHGVSCLSYKQSNKTLLSGSFDCMINQYDVNNLSLTNKFFGHLDGVWTIAQNTTNDTFASSGTETKIFLWDVKSKLNTSKISYHDQTVYNLKYSSDSNYLLSCSKGKIIVWDLKNTSKPYKEIFNKENKFVYASNFLLNNDYIVYAVIDGGLSVVNIHDLNDVTTTNIEFNKFKSDINLDTDDSVSLLFNININ